MIYFNTKTSATAEFTASDFKKLSESNQKRWREASESEKALHEKRKGQQAFLDSKNKEAKKKADKVKKAKSKLLDKNTEPATEKTGSKDDAKSEESK